MELNGRNIFGQKRLDFMFRLACSILGRSDEAQDMMQDVAERILRRQESLEDVRNIDSFLARAVTISPAAGSMKTSRGAFRTAWARKSAAAW